MIPAWSDVMDGDVNWWHLLIPAYIIIWTFPSNGWFTSTRIAGNSYPYIPTAQRIPSLLGKTNEVILQGVIFQQAPPLTQELSSISAQIGPEWGLWGWWRPILEPTLALPTFTGYQHLGFCNAACPLHPAGFKDTRRYNCGSTWCSYDSQQNT